MMKEAYAAYRSIQKFQFYLGGVLCYLHCDHKPLAQFFLGNMKNPTLNRWALELNKYNIVFKHIAGKKNVVADAISRLKQKSLYVEPRDKNNPTAKDIEDGVKNIIEEVHHIKSTQDLTHKEIDIPMLRSYQKENRFCKDMVKKVASRSAKTEFDIDQNGILCRLVRLQHGWELLSVIPRSLVTKIMYEYHEYRGHPGVTKTVNMIQRYFWFQGLRSSVYNHIRTCRLCIHFLPNRIRTRPLHLEITKDPFLYYMFRYNWHIANHFKRSLLCSNMYGLTHVLSYHSPDEKQVSRPRNYGILEEGITDQLM